MLTPKTKPLLGGVNLGRTNCGDEKQIGQDFALCGLFSKTKNSPFHANGSADGRPRVVFVDQVGERLIFCITPFFNIPEVFFLFILKISLSLSMQIQR